MVVSTEDYHEEEDVAPQGGGLGALAVLMLLVVGALYVLALVASRTNGFKGYIRDRLDEALGLPVQVERAYLSLRLDVVIEGIGEPEGLVAGRPGLQIARLILRVAPWRGWSGALPAIRAIAASDVYVAVAKDDAGIWQPASLAPVVRRIGAWIGIDLPSHASEEGRNAVAAVLFSRRLDVRNARITWYGPSDTVLQATGMNWQNQPLEVADRILMYRSLAVTQLLLRDGQRMDNVRIDFLQSPERTIVLKCAISNNASSEGDGAGRYPQVERRGDFPVIAPSDEVGVLGSAIRSAMTASP
jgi:hypothetical protein